MINRNFAFFRKSFNVKVYHVCAPTDQSRFIEFQETYPVLTNSELDKVVFMVYMAIYVYVFVCICICICKYL